MNTVQSQIDFLLLHISDSAFPTGAFAYSSGLEALAEFGFITSESELADYLFEVLKQAISFDVPFLNSICTSLENEPELCQIIKTYDATFVSGEMLNGSLNLGKNWLRLLRDVLQENEVSDFINDTFRRNRLPRHLLIVMAISLKKTGFTQEQIILFHLNSIIRDQVSAAIRLGIVGPMQGHALQKIIYSELSEKIKIDYKKTYVDASKSGVMTDLAQILHNNVYSKLFKN